MAGIGLSKLRGKFFLKKVYYSEVLHSATDCGKIDHNYYFSYAYSTYDLLL